MKTVRNYVIALIALALSTGSFLLSGRASSFAAPDKDKEVVVVNTTANPVPVLPQGSMTVSGNVNVANSPTVMAKQSGPWSQTIVNTDSNPIPVRSVGEASQTPFQKRVDMSMHCGSTILGHSFTVPAGKRFVIQHVALAAGPVSLFFQSNAVKSASFETSSGGEVGEYPLDFHSRQSPNGDPRYVSNGPILAFADGGTTVDFFIEFDFPVDVPGGCGSITPVTGTISGYLIDMP